MKRFCIVAVFSLAVVLGGPALTFAQAAPPAAEAKPNFSGRWRMDKEKSNFATFHAPDIVVQVVDERGPTMNVHTVETRGKQTSTADVSYFTDGTASNNVINGRQAESKAFWDGKALNIRTTEKDSKGDDVVIEDRWELSDDGQTLTRTSHIVTAKGSVDMTLISQKEKIGG